METLSESISNLMSIHTQQLDVMRNMVKDVNTFVFSRKIEELMPKIGNRREFVEYINEFAKFMANVVDEVQKSPDKSGKRTFIPSKLYSDEIQSYLFPFFEAALRMMTYPRILYDMTVVHIITTLEAFLSDFLVCVFLNNYDTLKSEKMVSYEVVFSFSSMEKLAEHLADEMTKKIIDENIDEVAKQIQQRFSVDVSQFKDFGFIRESCCRRNVIVHSNAMIDKKYLQKIQKGKIGDKLNSDLKYTEKLFDAVGQFIDYLDSKFSEKFGYERHLESNHLLFIRPEIGP